MDAEDLPAFASSFSSPIPSLTPASEREPARAYRLGEPDLLVQGYLVCVKFGGMRASSPMKLARYSPIFFAGPDLERSFRGCL